jgi:hypothetical protein
LTRNPNATANVLLLDIMLLLLVNRLLIMSLGLHRVERLNTGAGNTNTTDRESRISITHHIRVRGDDSWRSHLGIDRCRVSLNNPTVCRLIVVRLLVLLVELAWITSRFLLVVLLLLVLLNGWFCC